MVGDSYKLSVLTVAIALTLVQFANIIYMNDYNTFFFLFSSCAFDIKTSDLLKIQVGECLLFTFVYQLLN